MGHGYPNKIIIFATAYEAPFNKNMKNTIILFLFSLIAAQTAFGQVTHRDDKKILNAERSLKVEIELNSHEESADNNTPERQIKIYDVVEQQPSFPGGNGALMKWLESHIKYPAEARTRSALSKFSFFTRI